MNVGICRLCDLATTGLGFKSLQNQFFYVDAETIATHKIEATFLRPVVRMQDLDNAKYLQKPKQSVSVFFCKERIQDLSGTGALRYINAMAKRPATDKKQKHSGKRPTVKQVLEAQGTGFWYAPKAHLHQQNIWVRKAIDARFNPFLFIKPTALDQRCNYISPKPGIAWKALAALSTSSLFALSLESHGAAAMGAGALEVSTTELPELRVFDLREFSESQQEKLIDLAEVVWKSDPNDWQKSLPSGALKALDQWLLSQLKTKVTLNSIYADIANTCRNRLAVAKDRKTNRKTRSNADVGKLADSIARHIYPMLQSHRFPESFSNGSEKLPFNFASERLHVTCAPLMGQAIVTVREASSGTILMEQQFDRDVAQVISKSLLLGRREFSVPLESKVAVSVLQQFEIWFRKIQQMVEEGCRSSSVGTSYETHVYRAVFERLGIHPQVHEPELFGEFFI